MGTTKIINGIRREIALVSAQYRERLAEMQTRVEELEARLDRYDKPPDPPAPAASKRKKQRPEPTKEKRPVPIPDRPEVMQAAEVGQDPR